MKIVRLLASPFLVSILSWSLTGAAEDLAAHLAGVDATVLSADERAAATRMVLDDIQQRLRHSNEQSSADWRRIENRADWERFRAAKLTVLRNSLGQSSTPPPLQSRVTGTLNGDGYRIENFLFQSRPGLWVTANLYRPEKPGVAMPGILICHAHHTPKEHGELQDMGVTWARAGCLVLVMDQLGHGERRQHPFRSAADYARPFQVNRQDYYFRYDLGIQLHLAGESLIGWMAWDLMRGVDFLLAQEHIDPKRIVLLGAVAGGGDPAAVTAALDERITAAVPFNFGGPQPETRYPLPEDAETSFHYAGSGSWESTRNLRRSAAHGFLPWVIVGSIAPRRLVYAHEFNWNRERDPVWKRLQTIYGFFGAPEHLACTHGRGELRGQPPEATHCTHIGPPHRRLIHSAFKQWFDIDVTNEASDRHSTEMLRVLTPDAERERKPKKVHEILSSSASEQLERTRRRLAELSPEERRRQLRRDWERLLGNIQPNAEVKARQIGEPPSVANADTSDRKSPQRPRVERIVLTFERGIVVPVGLFLPPSINDGKTRPPITVGVAQAGKQSLLRDRAADVASMLERGVAVCMPDVRGTGETNPGGSRGRRSSATSLSSSELMLGGTMLGAQLRDFRAVLAWLRTRTDLDARQFYLWGDSVVVPNSNQTNFQIPRDDDQALPSSPEPLGGLLVLLAALFEDDVQGVHVHGGLVSFQSILRDYLVLLPHDVAVPGVLAAGDLGSLASALAPRAVRLEGLVDGWNRAAELSEISAVYRPAQTAYVDAAAEARFSLGTRRTSPSRWLAPKALRQ